MLLLEETNKIIEYSHTQLFVEVFFMNKIYGLETHHVTVLKSASYCLIDIDRLGKICLALCLVSIISLF